MKMQNTRKFTSMIALAITMAFVSSCKDDDENKPSNSFTYDGTKTDIKSVLFMYDESPSASPVSGVDFYRHELDLLSDGFTISGDDISGTGNAIVLEINGGSVNLDEGTYNFTGTDDNAQPFEIWDAAIYLNFSTSTSTGTIHDFTAGKLIVSKSGDIYTIKVEGTANGKAIKGQYIGSITSTPEE
jgi:hypothetical protein